jgi:hypothetical protein
VDGSTWHPALRPTAGTWAYDWQPGAVGTATILTLRSWLMRLSARSRRPAQRWCRPAAR